MKMVRGYAEKRDEAFNLHGKCLAMVILTFYSIYRGIFCFVRGNMFFKATFDELLHSLIVVLRNFHLHM